MKVPMPAPLWFAANVDSRRQVSDCAESGGEGRNDNLIFNNEVCRHASADIMTRN